MKRSARAYATLPHDNNKSVVGTIGTSILLGAIQRSAEEVSRRIATGTVDIKIFEIVAHLGRRHATVDS